MQKWPGFVGEDVDLLALLDGGADHAERGAITSGSKRPGVAVGENPAFRGHEGCAVASHGLISGDVFGVHAFGFVDQFLLDLLEGADAQALEFLCHATNRPEEIHRGGPRFTQDDAGLVEVALQVGNGFGCRVLDGKRDAHGGGHADGGRSAHDHGYDHVGDLLMSGAVDVGFFGGQLRLINEAYAVVGPFEGLNHKGRRWSFVVGRWLLP